MKSQYLKFFGAVCAALVFGVLLSDCYDLDRKPEREKEVDVNAV